MKKIVGMLVVVAMIFSLGNHVYAQDTRTASSETGINLLEQSYSIIRNDGTIETYSDKTRLAMGDPVLDPGESIYWEFLPLNAGYNFYSFNWSTAATFKIEVKANLIAPPIHQITITNKSGYSGSFHYSSRGGVTVEVINKSSSRKVMTSAMFNGK